MDFLLRHIRVVQTLPNGRPKVVERFDCSGCGDVDTTSLNRPDEKGQVKGLSGRPLQLTDEQLASNVDPAGEFRLGMKSLLDLYPQKVRERMMADMKQRLWDEPNKAALAQLNRDLAHFEELHPVTGGPPLSVHERLERENIEQALDALNAWDKQYLQLRPMYDIVLWRVAGDAWRVCIDVTETGDLANAIELGEYSATHEVKSIAEHLSVSVNVHDDGDLLEVVGMCCKYYRFDADQTSRPVGTD